MSTRLFCFCMLKRIMRPFQFLCRTVYCVVVLIPFVLRAASAKPQAIALLSIVAMGDYIRRASSSRLGFIEVLNSHEFVSMKPDNHETKRNIDFWDLRRGRIKTRIVPPENLHAFSTNNSVRISPDNKRIVAYNHTSFTDIHKLYVWNLVTRKLLRTINFGDRVFLDSVIFLPRQSKMALVQVRDVKKFKLQGHWETTLSNKPHHFYINLDSGQKVSIFSFPAAKFLEGDPYNRNSVMISPDQKRIVNIYEAGEGSYNSIEVASVQTGKTVARFQGNYDVELSGKGFFISNQQLLFGSWDSRKTQADGTPIMSHANHIMNIRTGQTRVCVPKIAHLKCLGGIASRLLLACRARKHRRCCRFE